MSSKPYPLIQPGSDEKRRYWAFISYSHRNLKEGRQVARALEAYRVPRRLVGTDSKFGWPVPRRIFPVFRDTDELPASADLTSNITDALDRSHTLLVLCSPASATSRWVNQEILHYKRIGLSSRVMALILDGEPHGSLKPALGQPECFPEALRYEVDGNGEITGQPTEPLAADIRPGQETRWHQAKLKLIAAIIGVDYDALVQRDRERARLRACAWVAASIALLLAFAVFYQSVQKQHRREQALAHLVAATKHIANRHLLHAANEMVEASGLGMTEKEMESELKLVAKAFVTQADALPSAAKNIESLSFSPDGKCLAVACDDGRAWVWNLFPGGAILEQKRRLSYRSAAQIAFHPDSGAVAVALWDGTVRIWDFRSEREPAVCAARYPKIRLNSVDFNHSGSLMATGGDDTLVNLWDTRNFSGSAARFAEHDDFVKSTHFSPDGTLLVSTGFDRTVKVFHVPQGDLLASFPLKDQLNRALITADNRFVVAAGLNGVVWIYSLGDRRIVKEIGSAHSARINDLALHPDGKTCLSAGDDGYVRRWSIPDGALVQSLEEHGPLRPDLSVNAVKIKTVAVSPDGLLAATGGGDGVIKIWKLDAGPSKTPAEILQALLQRAGGHAFIPMAKP